MSASIQLVRKGWCHLQGGGTTVFVRGQAHIGDEFLNTAALADRFLAQKTAADLDRLVSTLNGTWAAVVEKGDEVYLAVDHIRSFQLLYHADANGIDVFDDMVDYRKTHKVEPDERGVHEFLSSGFTWRDATFYKDVKSLRCAERIVFRSGNVDSKRYFRYFPNPDDTIVPSDDLFNRIDLSFLSAMKRLVESVGGRRLVIPLSGGFDSRLVVNYLYKIGYRNVLCYSYGPDGNRETEYAERVASALAFPWVNVTFSEGSSLSLLESSSLDDYIGYFCNGTTKLFSQDYNALVWLRKNGYLQSGDIVVPGHSFNVNAGSDLKRACHDWNVESEIVGSKALGFPNASYSQTVSDLRKWVDETGLSKRRYALETFVWEEELSKFTFNTGRIYEWFGCDWRFPLADIELSKLWLSIPYVYRYDRAYFTSIFNRLCVDAITGIPVSGYGHREQMSFRKRLAFDVKAQIPYAFKRVVRKVVPYKYSDVSDKSPRGDAMRKLIERIDSSSLRKRLEFNSSIHRWSELAVVRVLDRFL